MHIIEVIYILAAAAALSASVSQLRQLLIVKASEEFSLTTWLTWMITQSVTFVYMLHFGTLLTAVVSGAWAGFYTVMTALIIRYRRAPSETEPKLSITATEAGSL